MRSKVIYYLLYGIIIGLSVTIDMRLMYVLFFVLLLGNKKKCIYNCETLFLSIAVASIVFPDNYSTEFCFLLYFFVSFVIVNRGKIKKDNYIRFLTLFFLTSIISTILNCVPIINVLFSIVSFLPFIGFLIMLVNLGEKDFSRMHYLINDVFAIELIATVFNFIIYHSSTGDDWSCGTFYPKGGSQAQLFVLSAFLSIFYLGQYIRLNRKRINLWKAIIAFIMALTTNCWTLCVFFIFGIGLAYLFTMTPKRVLIILTGICAIPVALYLILNYAPGHISTPLRSMLTDTSYFKYRFYKAVVYKTTFVDIPVQDMLFGLIGNGVGYYNSRAALICTGFYVDFYNKLFSPSVSLYTQKNILDYLQYAALDGSSDYGSVLARPYSSILSLMGECGYIGVVTFFLLFLEKMKNKNFSTKLLLWVWLSFCFVENYFEYPKILVMLYFCLMITSSQKHVLNKGSKLGYDKNNGLEGHIK